MTTTPPQVPPVVYARAVSFLNSRTFWLNFTAMMIVIGPAFVQVLSSEDVKAVIPPRYQPVVYALTAGLNIFLRFITVRPIDFIKPGDVSVVEIPKIDPPTPKTLGD